jgi:hypothetical protein
MGTRISVFLTLITTAGLAFPALSQTPRNRVVTVQMGDPAHSPRLPYMAEYKTTQVRTLPGGSSTTQETTEVVAIDARDRRMTATTKVPSPGDPTPETRFIVFDPIAHIQISWISPGKKATVSVIPVTAAAQCSNGAAGAMITRFADPGTETEAPITKITQQDLGPETIHGVKARGRRTTTTTMMSGAIKNNQPQVTIFEVWTAINPGLRGLVVLQLNDNPPSSKMTKELVKFRQAEPDSTMFRLPPGYEIVNREVALDNCPSTEEMEPAAAPAK